MQQIQIRVVYDRKKQATSKKEGLIQLEVRHEAKRKFVTTGIRVTKNQFKAGRVCNREDADRLNKLITAQIDEITAYLDECNRNHSIFSLSAIGCLNATYTKASFIDFFANRIEERPIEESTKKQHRKVLRFLQTEYRGHLDTFHQLTLPAISRLDDYLHTRRLDDGRPMMQTSIHTYHKVIKCYINEAIRMELTTENPYTKFRCNTGQPRRRIVLTLDELAQLNNYHTTSILQAKVRDLFLVQCYTGLAYADLMETDFSKIEGNILYGKRKKTDTPYTIYLIPQVINILKRYSYALPHLSYDVYNRWLKVVAASAGITKTVTTHIGRHTFATTVALGSGIPIEVVSHMLGHTDIKTTQIYAKIQTESIIQSGKKMLQHII